MSSRAIRLLLLAVLLGGGFLVYRTSLRPQPERLESWAEAALRDLFGPDLTHGAVEVDLLRGVRVSALRVQRPGATEPALYAESVEVRHDVLAMSAGVLALEKVVVRGPVIATHETASGDLELDFPFDPPKGGGKAMPTPALVVEGGTLRLAAHPASKTLRPGSTLVLGHFRVTAVPERDGTVRVEGGFLPTGLGLADDEEITFYGTGNLERGLLDVHALWDRLRLTPQVRRVVAPELLARVEAERLAEGPHRLAVRIARDPAVEAGRVRLFPSFSGTVRMDISAFPGAETIDARTVEQINDLFGKIDLAIEVSGSRVDVRRLTTSLAGADVRAQGKIEDDGEVVDVDIRVDGLRLDDPALLKALGPVGERIRDEFSAAGRADVLVTLRRERGGPFRWEATVDLVDATLVYLGRADPVLRTPSGRPLRYGFPWAAEHCFGRVFVGPSSVRFDPIVGRHGASVVRIRGAGERARDGGETGYVRWDEGDTRVLLTIETRDVPVDRDLEDAVEGSEFAGFLDTFRPDGVIDRIVLDIKKLPHADAAAAVEVDVELRGERFRYAPFPLVLEDVEGRVALRREPIPGGGRERRFEFSARGRAAGGTVSVAGTLDAVRSRGRVRVEAAGVTLDGPLEQAMRGSPAGKGALVEAWDFLRPRGPADVVADLPAGDDPAPERFAVTMRGASVRLGADDADAGIAVEDLTGTITVAGGRADLARLDGRVGRAPIAIAGWMQTGPTGRWDLAIATRRIAVTRGLLAAIARASPCDPVFPEGVTVVPGGHLDLELRLRRQPMQEGCDLAAAVTVRNADLDVRLGDLELSVEGGFSVDGDDVRMQDLRATGPGLSISIPRGRYGPAGIEGRVEARLTDLAVTPEVLHLLPASLRASFADATKDRLVQAPSLEVDAAADGALVLRGAIGLTARPDAPSGGAPRGLVELAPVRVSAPGKDGARTIEGRLLLRGLDLDVGTRLEEVEGAVDLRALRLGDDPSGEGDVRLSRARVAGILLEDLVVPARWHGGILEASPVTATAYGGRLEAQVRVHTRAPVGFEGRVRLADVSLERVRADLAPGLDFLGTASLDAELESATGTLRDLRASGTASVRDGDLGELPPVATIPALLGALVPGSRKPRFTGADVEFRVEDETVEATSIRLSGPLFSLDGHGTVDFGGTLDVTLAPQFVKSLLLPGALQVPGVGDVLGVLREDPFYVVRVRGPLDRAEPTLVPFPFLGPRRPAASGGPPESFDAETSRRIPHAFR